MGSQFFVLLTILHLIRINNCQYVFCEQSGGDCTSCIRYGSNDYGLRIFTQYNSSYQSDCFIHYSRLDAPPKSMIINEFFNPSFNTFVIAHGWQTTDSNIRWTNIVPGSCLSLAEVNPNSDPEPCEPSDYDPQYWSQNGWNYIFLDWTMYNTDDSPVPFGVEDNIYQPVYNGQSV